MKTWIKRSIAGLFGITLLAGGLAACSGHRHHGAWSHASEAEQAEWRADMVDKASRKLDLDGAQKAKLTALADTLAAQRKQMVAQGGEPRAEFKAVIAGDRFDRDRAQALVDAKSTAMRSASPAVIAAAADFYDSLKPEQQQKVRSYLDRGGRRHGWRG